MLQPAASFWRVHGAVSPILAGIIYESMPGQVNDILVPILVSNFLYLCLSYLLLLLRLFILLRKWLQTNDVSYGVSQTGTLFACFLTTSFL